MTSRDDYPTCRQLLDAYAGGEVSPVEVADRLLARIERLQPGLTPFVRVEEGRVREEARLAEGMWASGRPRPLEGVFVAVKDVFSMGVTTAGSRLRIGARASAESVAVRRLREAGAIIVGKTATYEFAFGRPSAESLHPPARNPWDPALEPGGSSSGSSVAVAAGMAGAAIGTDTAGSVRWPAAQCGVVGLKPTYGRVPRTGIIPLAWSLDHAGVIARTTEDAALLLATLSGFDAGDPTSSSAPVADYASGLGSSVRGYRLGVPWGLFEDGCHAEIRDAFAAALGVLGDLGIEIVEAPSIRMREALATTYPLLLAEAASYHLPDLQSNLERYSRDLRVFFPVGLLVDSQSYLLCQRARERIRRVQAEQLVDLDGYVLPTVGFLADPIPERPTGLSFLGVDEFQLYTMVFNLTGLPAVSTPMGFTAAGLPVGLQVAGRPFDEATVLAISHAFERATRWTAQHPPMGSLA